MPKVSELERSRHVRTVCALRSSFPKCERTPSELGLLCIPPAHCAHLCRFLRVQLWTSESTKHANDAGTSKSSPSFWRSCRTTLTNEVYRFSPIWHISSVKITRALDDAVLFSNNGRQQWPLLYRNRGPIASVAVSHLGKFQNERILESFVGPRPKSVIGGFRPRADYHRLAKTGKKREGANVQPRRIVDGICGFPVRSE
jgi:hypothetical protein